MIAWLDSYRRGLDRYPVVFNWLHMCLCRVIVYYTDLRKSSLHFILNEWMNGWVEEGGQKWYQG